MFPKGERWSLDQLKTIKRKKSRLKRDIKMLLNRSEKNSVCTSKTKECYKLEI